jgi:gamma-glutamyltranspeptidase/glutathione hydrolase
MEVRLEDGIGEQTASKLRAMGHQVSESTSPVNEFGGGQAIYLDRASDVLLGASDRRKDGCALGY